MEAPKFKHQASSIKYQNYIRFGVKNMLFDILHILYLIIAGLAAIFISIELWKQKNWRGQLLAAIVLVPLILRVLLIR
jgi:glycopeptide antibiotics resistance protein